MKFMNKLSAVFSRFAENRKRKFEQNRKDFIEPSESYKAYLRRVGRVSIIRNAFTGVGKPYSEHDYNNMAYSKALRKGYIVIGGPISQC